MNKTPTYIFKEFTFVSDDDAETVVKIFELPGADYGSYVWPCAPVLAQYVWENRVLVYNQSVLEIGAGTGLPGIVAAKCGARVILSDSVTNTLSHDLCQKSVELNELKNVSVTGITWGEVSPRLLALPKIDLILASDCFYNSKGNPFYDIDYRLCPYANWEEKIFVSICSCIRVKVVLSVRFLSIATDFENVIMTMSFILHRCPAARVWCTYQERSSERSIEYLLDKWSMEGKEINLPNTDTLSSTFTAHMKHTIRLFEIKKKTLDS